ncbi:transposase [Sorangium sp. So ce385]|uniref:transposase n=1 Tax=Sorangium sp. So ce385 TaxID=3133308 RepID=UPI003F5B9664
MLIPVWRDDRSGRTSRASNGELHDSLIDNWEQIVALGDHHPATGRTEALNNNWETLVRRARGYRDHEYPLRSLPTLQEGERLLLDGRRTTEPDDGTFSRDPAEQHGNDSTNRQVLDEFTRRCETCDGFRVV